MKIPFSSISVSKIYMSLENSYYLMVVVLRKNKINYVVEGFLYCFHPKYLPVSRLKSLWLSALGKQRSYVNLNEIKRKEKLENVINNPFLYLDYCILTSSDPLSILGHYLYPIFREAKSRGKQYNLIAIKKLDYKEKHNPISSEILESQFKPCKDRFFRNITFEGTLCDFPIETEQPEPHPMFFIKGLELKE